MLHFLSFIITGLVAGLIAERVMSRPHGILISIVIGVIGAWIGGFLAGMLHISLPGAGIGHWILEVLVAAAGAIILLWVLGLFRNRSARA
jgi:uncharacterized membrane protein YeaQ/YmgE (transglycosylase-associated protein family)